MQVLEQEGCLPRRLPVALLPCGRGSCWRRASPAAQEMEPSCIKGSDGCESRLQGRGLLAGTEHECQHSKGGVLGRAVLCRVGLNRSRTRAETELLLLVFVNFFSLTSVGFLVVEKALGSSRRES